MADDNDLSLPDEFQELLRQELSIEPLPGFAARLRQRVGKEAHRSHGWRMHWLPALGSFAAVASLAAAIALPAWSRWTSTPVPPAPPAIHVASDERPRLDPLPLPPVPSTIPSARADRARQRERTVELRAGESRFEGSVVIIDARQRAALYTLFRMMDQGRVSNDSFKATVPVSLDPIADSLTEIVVAPVVVSDFPPGGVLPGENVR